MITRRAFLIGAATALTLPLVDRFKNHIARHGEPLLVQPKESSGVLNIYPDRDFQIGLNGDPWDCPTVTWREYLEDYRGEQIPTTLDGFRELRANYDLWPSQVDETMPPELFVDSWGTSRSPNAMAYHYLNDLDLGPELRGHRNEVGGLRYMMGPCPGNDYVGVHADNMVSVSLLQHRLNELDTGLIVQLGK